MSKAKHMKWQWFILWIHFEEDRTLEFCQSRLSLHSELSLNPNYSIHLIMKPSEIPTSFFSKTTIFDFVILKNFIVNEHLKGGEKFRLPSLLSLLSKVQRQLLLVNLILTQMYRTSFHSELFSSNKGWHILPRCPIDSLLTLESTRGLYKEWRSI